MYVEMDNGSVWYDLEQISAYDWSKRMQINHISAMMRAAAILASHNPKPTKGKRGKSIDKYGKTFKKRPKKHR